MKLSVLFSIFFHTLLFTAFIVLPSRSRAFRSTAKIYEVELVSMPKVVEEAPKAAENRPVSRPTEPVPKPITQPKKKVEKAPIEDRKEKPAETASVDSTTAAGGGSQVKVEGEDFPYSYYLSLIRYRIQENWRPPYQNVGEGEKMSAVVGFRVLRNGRVESIALEQSSNRFLFDQAAERAVRSLGFLPPLPDEFVGEHLTVHIEFESVW